MNTREAILNITRRRFLAWVGATGAGAVSLGTLGCGSGSSDPRPAGTETRTLLFGMDGLPAEISALRLWVRGNSYPLVEINQQNRVELYGTNLMAARANPAKITHAARGVQLPTDQPTGMLLLAQNGAGNKTMVGTCVSCPASGVESVTRQAASLTDLTDLFGNDIRLQRLGITEPPSTVDEVLALNDITDTAVGIAQWLVFQHPTIMNLDSEGCAITMALVNQSNELAGVVSALDPLLTNVGTYGQYFPMTDGNGNQLYVNPDDPMVDNGKPARTFQPFVESGTIYEGQPIHDAWTSALNESITNAATAISNVVQDTEALEGSSWDAMPGEPPQTTDIASGVPPTSSVNFVIDSSSFHSQTKVEVQSISQGSKGAEVTIRIFNNNEKFQGIYAQFFDANNDQIAPISGGKLSDSDLSTNLGSMATVLTVVGIPIFDTNFKDFVVKFPPDATYANILVCSLGTGSKWISEFGSNYQGKAYPDECYSPLVWTSVVNLGFPTLALLLDVGILGSIYKTASDAADEYLDDEASLAGSAGNYPNQLGGSMGAALSGFKTGFAFLTQLLTGSLALNSVGNGGAGSTLRLVLSFGQLFWQVLRVTWFSKLVAQFYASVTASKAEEAVPLVGTAMAVLAAVSDITKLSVTISEWVTEDYVIKRKLSGSYTATVTVNHDPKDSVFPRSARNWKITPQLSGDRSLASLENTSFQSTAPASGPLTIQIPDIPIGGQIRYVMSFTNPQGWTVGTVTSKWFDNFDINNLPSPNITIMEIPPPLNSGSSFTRTFTTQFDTTAGDYDYTTASTIPGTIQDQQTCNTASNICGAGTIAVGTVTGLVGYVYNTQFGWYVRQLSSGTTPGSGMISVDTAYAAKPLLIYDSIGASATDGSNFLLEPLASGEPGYNVRKLNLTTAGFGIDPSQSWGQFNDTLDTVVLHPAGFIVGINTESGKIHLLALPDGPGTPGDLSTVPTATMKAGTGNASGNRPGLLQRPIGVGIGLNGMVLVLEQDAGRIQAFNHVGNPVTFFDDDNGNANASNYLILTSSVTHLGVSVDGSGYIYVLNYSGDGADVGDYGVDVYDPGGSFVFRGTGVNAASFNVDYWRNVFTQNFQAVQKTSGGAHITAAGVAEPSMSIWVPDTPM